MARISKTQGGALAKSRTPARFEPPNRRRLSGPGLRTFLNIADLWSLTDQQCRLILGFPSRATYCNWRIRAREHRSLTLTVDVLTRISAILGIYGALRVLHADERQGALWLRTPHNSIIFGGHPPLQLMTCGTQDGLLTVRRFLDRAQQSLCMPPSSFDAGFEGGPDVIVG
jgi:hypothetical protein